MSRIPDDYEERVYAGVLGKIIGVYLGRPFEGWAHEQIVKELGEIRYYAHELLNKPLIVVDDDISGTFTFLRAMPDYGHPQELSPAQIGQTWLNYLIENKTVLWWGGLGMSTEHTAYLRLKRGIRAPESGSIALNGKVVAEQIGAQIFIDGWGMIAPGDPERAAELARRAASVSHDGEAVYGAQVIAAMEAAAFVEGDIDRLLDTATSLIPKDSLIYRLIGDVRDWHAQYEVWQEAFYRIVARYGYDKYGGNCHIVPNHAVVILALLYSENSFSRALSIVNTAGWDTDCNSGNVGCLMGIKNGLAGLDDGPDWRTPVADRMYLPTADGGRAVTDALHEALQVAQIGRILAGEPAPLPKKGARFHFDLPGARQGWMLEERPETRGTAWLENVPGHSEDGSRVLAIHFRGLAPGRCARLFRETLPLLPPSQGYRLVASPTIYPGQHLSARLLADADNPRPVELRPFLRTIAADDSLQTLYGPDLTLSPGQVCPVAWDLPTSLPGPIARIGFEISAGRRADGTVYLDWLTWSGEPHIDLDPPAPPGPRWRSGWVQACTAWVARRGAGYSLIQNEGAGLLIHGTREWRNYRFSATCTPHLARAFGIAARVQGLERYYVLRLVQGNELQLVRRLDGETVLARAPYTWELYQPYHLALELEGQTIRGLINGEELLEVVEDDSLDGGAIALWLKEGRVRFEKVTVRPL